MCLDYAPFRLYSVVGIIKRIRTKPWTDRQMAKPIYLFFSDKSVLHAEVELKYSDFKEYVLEECRL